MTTIADPLVSVVLAVHDGERYLPAAIASVLRQTMGELELLVVDDCSRDATRDLLADVDDPRIHVTRNEEQLGLAASLNRGLELARGRYVARLDADDLALPARLERQLERMRRAPAVSIVGSSVLEIDDADRLGRFHPMPSSPVAVRWSALFGAPFYHPSVLVEREVLERHGLRYEQRFAESEDYDLWTRLLRLVDGANVPEALVLYRLHSRQASTRRRDLQRSFQREVALREIAEVAPRLEPGNAELAWLLGSGEDVPARQLEAAADAYAELLDAFSSTHSGADLRPVRETASRVLARAALRASGVARARLVRLSLQVDPLLPAHTAAFRRRRRLQGQSALREADRLLATIDTGTGAGRSDLPIRLTVVSPEPTPFRSEMFDRIAQRPELDLTVIYSGRTIAGRTWTIVPRHRAVFLRGLRIPARRVLLHDYPITPGIAAALRDSRPDVVVVSGWSTFAAQAAAVWCRSRGVPYLLYVESHDIGPRAGWRTAVKGAIVPRLIRSASRILVVGTLARESMIARGADPESILHVANTIDAAGWGERADRLATRRPELRRGLGAAPDDVVVLSIARLVPEKGLDTLVRAVAEAGDPRLLLALVGEGPEREPLAALARVFGVRLVFADPVPWEQTVEYFVATDVFALLSVHEPWGVVVNEAAACGLPLVLSDRVGAARDLLVDGENGALVPAGDVAAAAAALRPRAADWGLRAVEGARSRELMRGWGYEPSIENLIRAAQEATRSDQAPAASTSR